MPSALLFTLCTLMTHSLLADPVPVRYREGTTHGFLLMRSMEGKVVASGDLVQSSHGDTITAEMTFHYKDGSLYQDAVTYRQHGSFQLIRDHQVEKGPSFKQAMDVITDVRSNTVTVRSADKDGKEKVEVEHMDLPADIANGMVLTLVKNIRPADLPATVPMIVATPKPRLIKLALSHEGDDAFSVAGVRHTAERLVIKIDLGGVAGVVAPLIGKQPTDTHMWVLRGIAPAFIKSEGPLYNGGPIWRIEQTSPQWSQAQERAGSGSGAKTSP